MQPLQFLEPLQLSAEQCDHLRRGETAFLQRMAVNSLTVLMDEKARPMVHDLWVSPSSTAMDTLKALHDLGLNMEVRRDDDDGLMRLCALTWGKDLPVDEAWRRVDQWVTWGGSLNWVSSEGTALGKLAMSLDNVTHVPGLMARGADPSKGEWPLPVYLAERGALVSLTRLIQMGVRFDWENEAQVEKQKGMFGEVIHKSLLDWLDNGCQSVLDDIRDFAHVWLNQKEFDPWKGQISQTQPGQPLNDEAPLEWLANVDDVIAWPGLRWRMKATESEKSFLQEAWIKTMAPLIHSVLDNEWTEHGSTRLRGLWLAWLARDEKHVEWRVRDLPKGMTVFMPLGVDRANYTRSNYLPLDMSDAWLSLFRDHCDGFETSRVKDDFRWVEMSEVASDAGRDLEKEWVTAQRSKTTHERYPSPLPERQRSRPRA